MHVHALGNHVTKKQMNVIGCSLDRLDGIWTLHFIVFFPPQMLYVGFVVMSNLFQMSDPKIRKLFGEVRSNVAKVNSQFS